jgi:hypothetical protein
MIGLILYEAFDLVYHVGKIGYNGVSGAYRWYYSIPDEQTSKEEEKENKIKMLENQIMKMENRQQSLEKRLQAYENNEIPMI